MADRDRRGLSTASNRAKVRLVQVPVCLRNTKAGRRLLIRLMKKQGCLPKRIVTDELRSYSAARRQIMPMVEHRSHKGLNNRAENSHLPLRERTHDATLSITRRVAALHKRLFGGPKSLRPATFETLSHDRPSASPQSDRTLEVRHRHGSLSQIVMPKACFENLI